MKAFMVAKHGPEIPATDDAGKRMYHGFVRLARIGDWAVYLVSGTGAQLLAIDALPNVIGICAVTESGDVKWGELDANIALAVRTKLNTWLTARGLPTIPAGWTNRKVLVEVAKRMDERFDLGFFDVADAT